MATMRNNLLGGAASFASFLGIGKGTRRNTASRPRADDDDSDMRRSRRADEDETFEDDENGDPADPADLPDDGGDDAEGDPEEEPTRGARRKKVKKAKRRAADQTDDDADLSDDGSSGPDDDDDNDDDPDGDQSDDQDDCDDDDDSDTEMRGRSPAASARRRERARCAAIFSCKAAGQNIEYAAHLAFNTRLGRREAIGLLKAAPSASSGGGLSRAMDRYAGARPGPDRVPVSNSAKAIADSWDKVLTSTQGKR